MRRNLILDGQILQTNAWYRGMGKYIMQVLRELSQNALDDTLVSIIFNTSLACDTERFETIAYMCPNVKQVRCSLPLASDKYSKASDYKSRLSRCIQGEVGEGENYYFITSLFSFDFFAEFPKECRKLAIFYDLTPLLFWRDLGGYFPPELYMTRFEKLFEADRIFCISDTTRLDLLNVFGLEPSTIVNINGGFTKIAETTEKPTEFALPEKFILFPTGDLPHKNNEIAVKGFAQYCRQRGGASPLLITSHFEKQSQEKLLSLSDKIIFTGNIADEKLEWLYENADSILFASKYEGLGMPILDAVASNKPVITSKIPVFEEMSKDAFYYFDSTDPSTLAAAFEQAHNRSGFEKKVKHYPGVLQKYTWQNTAQEITDNLAIDSAGAMRTGEHRDMPKPRIAVACLHPGISGQLGRKAEALHFSLSQRFQIDYYFDANGHHYRDMERPTFLDHIGVKVFEITKLTIATYKKYDSIVYLLDDAVLPSRVAQRACIFPGIAVTNDWPELGRQAAMLKEVAVSNQIAVRKLEGHSYAGYQELTALLYRDISRHVPKRNTAERILRSPGTNRSIIKKLKTLPSS